MKDDTEKSINSKGAKIRAARNRMLMTQAQLAEAMHLGIDGGRTVSKWENGRRNPSASHLALLVLIEKEHADRLKGAPKLPTSDRGEITSSVHTAAKERRLLKGRQTPADDRQDDLCRDAHNAASAFQNSLGFCGVDVDRVETAFNDMVLVISEMIRQARRDGL